MKRVKDHNIYHIRCERTAARAAKLSSMLMTTCRSRPPFYGRSKKKLLACLFSLCVLGCFAQKKDTLLIGPKDLLVKHLPFGKSTYVVYNKQPRAAASKIVLVKIAVAAESLNGQPVIAIDQEWEADTIVHSAHTLLSERDLSTLQHQFFWKRLGYSTSYDFIQKKIEYEGKVADSVKTKAMADFLESFGAYNLNWHSDLVLFPLLPYKDGRTFQIRFFDPGFGKTRTVLYSVTGTEVLVSPLQQKLDCWILQVTLSDGLVGYQKFWISKSSHEVLKEEDSFNGTFRYKLKAAVVE